MKMPLNVLLVEDSPDDAKLMLLELTRSGYAVSSAIVATAAEMRSAIVRQVWDLILCDYSLPSFSGEAAMRLAQELECDAPFIYVSGTIGEEVAVQAMKNGAQDYVMKGSLARLAPAVERELRDAHVRREARLASMALRESEHRYRHLFETLSDAAFLIDETTGFIVDTNAEGETLLGRAREEIIGMRWERLRPPQEAQDPVPCWRLERGGEQRAVCDTLVHRGDGTTVPVQVSASVINLHGDPFTLALFRDITARKRAESALRQSEERFRSLSAFSPVGIFQADSSGGYTYINPRLREILGMGPELALGDGWIRNLHPDDRARVVHEWRRVTNSGSEFAMEFRVLRTDGSVRHVQARSRPIVADGKSSAGVVGSVDDITERKDDERRMRLMMRELDHRVRNNLATVVSLSQLVLAGATSFDEFRQAFIERMQALARMHATIAKKHWLRVELQEVMQSTLEAYLIGGPVTLDEGCPEVSVSPKAANMLSMVMFELASNAVRHGALTRLEGRVSLGWTVETPESAEPILRINWREAGGPSATRPVREGVGTALIYEGVRCELRGDVQLLYGREGFSCELKIPVDALEEHVAEATLEVE